MNDGLKKVGIVVVGVASIGICYIGYKHSNNVQYENRVAYAATAVNKNKQTLTEVQKELKDLYQDKEQAFLKKDLKEEAISAVSSKLDEIKTSSEDLGIKDADLPKDAKTLDGTKADMEKQLTVARQKFRIQQNVNKLFTKPVADFKKVDNDKAIVDKLKVNTVGDIRESVNLQEDDQWKTNIVKYLDDALKQVENVTAVEKSIGELMKDGKITSKATVDTVEKLKTNVKNIRNEDTKKRYTEPLEEIRKQLREKLYGSSSDTTSSADSETNNDSDTTGADTTTSNAGYTDTNYYQNQGTTSNGTTSNNTTGSGTGSGTTGGGTTSNNTNTNNNTNTADNSQTESNQTGGNQETDGWQAGDNSDTNGGNAESSEQ